MRRRCAGGSLLRWLLWLRALGEVDRAALTGRWWLWDPSAVVWGGSPVVCSGLVCSGLGALDKALGLRKAALK